MCGLLCPYPRTRIRAPFGTPEFDAEYQAALASNPRPAKTSFDAGSLAWLIERYRETTSWTDLSLATRRNRENHFKRAIEKAGHQPVRAITSAVITKGRDSRSATPAQARNFLDALRGLFKWAKEAKHVTVDPTVDVKNAKRRKGPGFPVWTEEDAAAYDKRWSIGTKERVWRDVLFYIGLRRGDAVTLGRQHVRDGWITLRTEKSQEKMIVSIPILPVLQQTLDRSDRRACIHLWQERQAADQRVIRQRVQGCVPSGRTVQSLGAWLSQDRSNARC